MTVVASGSSSVDALLNPVNPSIATIFEPYLRQLRDAGVDISRMTSPTPSQ